jgi:putative endonuclease
LYDKNIVLATSLPCCLLADPATLSYMAAFYTYILECSDGSLYVGKTNDLAKRFKQHNGLLPKGAKYTRARRPAVFKYIEQYESNSDALKREWEIKQLTHQEKQKLCQKNF